MILNPATFCLISSGILRSQILALPNSLALRAAILQPVSWVHLGLYTLLFLLSDSLPAQKYYTIHNELLIIPTCFSFGRYVAPEYASTGMLNERSDVYSFGILIMEVIAGRNPVDYSRPPEEV